MSFTMTRTVTESFTMTQAKYLASKLAADMRRCQQVYGEPGDTHLNNLCTELAILLRDGYVKSFEFGYVRISDDERVVTWKYTVDESGNLISNDRPGRVLSGINISGASFRNYLIKSAKWHALTAQQQAAIEATLPIQRVSSPEYGSSLGTWQDDLCYSSSGVAMARKCFKPFGV